MNSKKKGNRVERDVAKLMKSWSGWEFSRVPMSGGLRWKKVDNIAGDITCTEPNKICYFSIEVKAHKDINFAHLLYNVKSKIDEFWKQTYDDSKRAKKVPLLFMRYNGMPQDLFFVVIDKKFAQRVFTSLSGFNYYMYTREYLIITSIDLINIPFRKLNKGAKRWLGNQAHG